jgi:small nuclear ribonucleoprotein (snRNP)-like protein
VRSRVLRSRFRQRCLVTLKTGDSFIGVLFDADNHALVLRNAEAIGINEDKTNAPVDGEILILLADVVFVQKPSA